MIYGAARKEREFRDQSNNPKMAGVAYVSWSCKICKKNKPIQGRKSLGWKAGFCCADCAKEL